MNKVISSQAELPRAYRGEPLSVAQMNKSTRAQHGLSTSESIVEVVGNQALVEEAVAYARHKGLVGFDLETGGQHEEDGLNPWKGDIILVQLGDESRQYLIWYQTIDPTPLIELLADPKVAKVGVNLKFDLRWFLVKHGFEARGWNMVDAMIIEQVIGCGMFSEDDGAVGMTLKLTGMGMMARRWLGLDLPKDEEIRTGWGKMIPGQWYQDVTDESGNTVRKSLLAKKYYAADDVIIPLRIIKKQRPWIKRLGLVETVNLEHSFLPVLAEMEVRGVKIDMEKWNVLAAEAEQKVNDARRALDKLFDVTVTIEIDEEGNAVRTRDKQYGSTQQLKDLIRDYMKSEHGMNVILANKHLKQSLLDNGANPERIEKIFADGKKKLENLAKGRPGKQKAVGTPSSTDLVLHLWEEVQHLLPKNSFYMKDTESKTFRLYRYIHDTPNDDVDPELPTNIGLPPTLVDPIADLRKFSKAAGTYGYNWHKLVNQWSKRLHCDFVQAALTTGRISSTPNFQNLPSDKRYRSCFIPEEGYKYVGADWSQIEPRIIAHYSQDPTYMRVFWSDRLGSEGAKKWCKGVTEKLDLYTEVGKMVGVIPKHYTLLMVKGDESQGIEALPDGEKGRKQAKIIVLGLGYGTGVNKFWLMLIVDTKQHHKKGYAAYLHETFWGSVTEVKKALDAFSDITYPGEDVVKWGRTIRKKSPRKIWHPMTDCDVTWSQTAGGRKRFYKPDSYKWWSTGRNHPIQGTGADCMKKTAVLFTRWCWENKIDGGLVNLIHDELLAEVRDDDRIEQVRDKMSELMTMVGEAYCPTVPITAEAMISDFWRKG